MTEDYPQQSDIYTQAALYHGEEMAALARAHTVVQDLENYVVENAEYADEEDWQDLENIESKYISALIKSGEFAMAEEVMAKGKIGAERAQDLRLEIVGGLAYFNGLDAAQAYTHKQGASFKYDAVMPMARGLVKRGAIDAALELPEKHSDPTIEIQVKLAVAEAAGPDSPFFDEVKQMIDSEANDNTSWVDTDDLYCELAKSLLEVGRPQDAYDVLPKDEGNVYIDEFEGIERDIAKGLGADSELFRRLLRDYEAESFDIHTKALALKKWSDLVVYLGEISHGDYEGQHAKIEGHSLNAGRLTEARAMIARGEYEAALSLPLPSPTFYEQARLYVDVIRAMLQKGLVDEAERLKGQLKDEWLVEAEIAFADAAQQKIEALGLPPEATLDHHVDLNGVEPPEVRHVGAHAVRQWEKFKAYDAATFARLAHGAAQVAHAYMSDEERLRFIRTLGSELQVFSRAGMFDDGKHQAVLKNLSEALATAGDAGSTSLMLETLYANMGEATGLRLIKSLLETGNAKAAAAGIDLLMDPGTDRHVYHYLLHKLASTGHIDSQLPGFIADYKIACNFPTDASRKMLQKFYQETGIQADVQLMHWAIHEMYGKEVLEGKLDIMGTIDERLDKLIETVQQSREQFAKLDQAELLKVLATQRGSANLYFLLHGGRTNYALIQHYHSGKFAQAIGKAWEVEKRVKDESVAKELWQNAPSGWQEAMQARRRPSEDLVWQTEIGAASKELRSAARDELRGVLGVELQWLLGPGDGAANFGTSLSTVEPLSEKSQKRLEGLLGEKLAGVFRGDEQDMTIGDFEKLKNNLLAQLRQLRQAAKQQKDAKAEAWRDILTQAEHDDPVQAMRHILALVSRNPDRSLRPKGADAEWVGHLTGLSTTIRESQRKGNDSRTVTLRYLDGKEDFAELLRFADGAQCCFTSEDTAGVEMDPSGDWRMRINRDPHWFVFSIEDTPPNATKRVSSGFVFGSLARVDNEPALAINGIYMQRKTDSAANTILDEIVARFARPMGVKTVVIATKHGGSFRIDTDKWQPAQGHDLYRPRAIADSDGEPEEEIYDDLGVMVNGHEEIGENVWRQILR